MAINFPMKSSNPALASNLFSQVRASSPDDVMTLNGTINKTGVALAIALLAGAWSWSTPSAAVFFFPAMIFTFIVAMTLIFKKEWSPVVVPIYAAAEGMMLGTISQAMNFAYHGIVFQAICLTMAVAATMLIAYRTQLIVATDKFKMGVAAATGGIFIFYFVTMVMSFFGVNMGVMNSSSPMSIGISVVIVIVAALNLIMDFDFIESGARSGNAPKYLEWYGAFALLVTLVWLYVEILRLLSKLQSSRD